MRGKQLDKIGHDAQDTSELFFEDVRVPAHCLLGEIEGSGFAQLMKQLPKERLIIALQGVIAIDQAIQQTVAYTKERRAFGKPIFSFQNTQFKLAECATEAALARTFASDCLEQQLNGTLSPERAAMAKLWVTDAQCRIVDECLQLHGGYGYINETPIARLYRDARAQRIYGGTNEIMKMVIARSL